MPFDSPAHWQRARSFHHSRYDEAFVAARERSVSVCLPARDCAATVGPIVEALAGLRDRAVIDQLVVIDGDSADATARIAGDAGATVFSEARLMPGYGPVAGKGDAMWRSLSVLDGELVCFLDADVLEFSTHYALGLLGPLIEFDEIDFVKAFYRRPFRAGDVSLADGGGRVNHLLARPALAIFYPELAGVRQPLAGEVAARRSLLETLPFATGYGVEIAMLLDVLERVGLDGMAQVDLDTHHNSHQPLLDLSPMAYAVLKVLALRLEREGRLVELDAAPLLLDGRAFDAPLAERPPMVSAR
ncbi:MAG TPA: glucosyl-3-phosphoglycerate synthase [Solirubrobacteraceae bacterium]|nr:glucosyl-3-phosphoglycerate synthase [Solirubrobacteraceae bacterium]